MILLGFATLMFGMEAMSGAVSGLRDLPEFQNMFVAFTNPVLGVLAGAILTAIIQSSSASVGILQALASTGAVTYGAAIPIIMGCRSQQKCKACSIGTSEFQCDRNSCLVVDILHSEGCGSSGYPWRISKFDGYSCMSFGF